MSEYKFSDIEKYWQKYWRDNHIYKVENDTRKPKYYVLDMFPYPSGAGLHVGHPLGYIASDIYARYKRLNGYNVLHPMGYDSFGLPAEQYAIQTGQHPAITTKQNIDRYREQMDMLGFSFDWSREVRTSDPNYYKWTQWIFIKLYHSWYNTETNKSEHIDTLIAKFKQGIFPVPPNGTAYSAPTEWEHLSEKVQQEILMQYRNAYLSESYVNWCPALGTVLANDEVKDGVSERGGHPVERKLMMQWSMRITSYAERLLKGLEKIDWPEPLKETQRNWIGKSSGSSLVFRLTPNPSPLERGARASSNSKVPEGIATADKSMWKELKEFSKTNRKNQTEAESKLWEELRNSKLGFKFRRQHAIQRYIADFVCLSKGLVIEVDGGIHDEQKEYDEYRTQILNENEFEVLRFTNEEVLSDFNNVISSIRNKLVALPDRNLEEHEDENPSPMERGRGEADLIEVFTTRPDTIFGVSFVTLAPEHELVLKIATPEYQAQVQEYINYAKNRSERERQADVKKITGQFTGAYVQHPFTGEDIPVWIGEYVLAGYGTGAVMGVPAHDSRDYAFAKHFGLHIKPVIQPQTEWDYDKESYDEKVGTMVNSDFLNGLEVKQAIIKAIEKIQEHLIGQGRTNYRLRDAIFGRQRYWGEPIPIYYKEGIPYTLEEKDLPLQLPEVDKYLPTEDGEPPLARAKDWTWPHSNSPLRGENQAEPLSKSQMDKNMNSDLEAGRIYKTADPAYYAVLKEFSEANRNNPTLAEEVLWKELKGDKLGYGFRRQHIVRNYIADFVCLERKLVIEADGGYHNQVEQKDYDTYRDQIISNEGFEVLRFTNDEILNHKESVIEKIKNALIKRPINSQKSIVANAAENTTLPSPLRGERERGPLETTTMPGWAGSSWYLFRYMDPNNTGEFASKEALDYWKEVDVYIGGSEHGTGHLLYVRYWTKFLYDMNLIPVDEPAKKLINQGMIQGRSSFVHKLSYLVNQQIGNVAISKIDINIFVSEKACITLHDEGFETDSDLYSNIFNMLKEKFFINKDINYIGYKEYSSVIHLPITKVRVDVNVIENDQLNIIKFRERYKNDSEYNKAVFVNDNGIIILPDEEPSESHFTCDWEVEKMSKSKWNVVTPDDIVAQYGADTLRLYEMFLGPLEQSKPWNTQGIEGVHRFLKKLWGLFYDRNGNYIVTEDEPNAAELKVLHKAIKKASEDVEAFSFNTSVSAFMICVNELLDLKCNKRSILEQLLIIISPYAPHICEELYNKLNEGKSVITAEWPKYNHAYLVENTFNYPVSVNGKFRLTLELALDLAQADVEKAVLQHEVVQKWTEGKPPKKIVFVKGKIVNVVV